MNEIHNENKRQVLDEYDRILSLTEEVHKKCEMLNKQNYKNRIIIIISSFIFLYICFLGLFPSKNPIDSVEEPYTFLVLVIILFSSLIISFYYTMRFLKTRKNLQREATLLSDLLNTVNESSTRMNTDYYLSEIEKLTIKIRLSRLKLSVSDYKRDFFSV
jgi:hypothetical protein